MEPDTSIEENATLVNKIAKREEHFKKPILIGKIGRLPRKVSQLKESVNIELSTENKNINESVKRDPKESLEESNLENIKEICSDVKPEETSSKSLVQQTAENSLPLPYKEPIWSGLPKSNGKKYSFDVLKNGSIIETINLMDKSFWVFGRLNTCNICMQHPTISRYHAVLQYRSEVTEMNEAGFYIYDLASTHGTYLNKNRLKPKVYTRMQVGHMLKLGCSTRSYILNGPEYDEEEESELSVTELKQKRVEELQKLEEAEKENEERKRKLEERGVDWGLGEDADAETDLSENPYALTNNEELYLDDPKKALRGFFEREGLDLEYECNEQGMGQFLCKVELPVDDEMGRPIVAEVLHKGKKKEAVVQCALEACRILDRFGMLRQAIHESRKRKAKNWEENDYYDSDDDTFLDRTGTIEKKREKRMNAKVPQKAETYESLLEKERSIASSISDLEKQLAAVQAKNEKSSNLNAEEDSLDTFMKSLTDSKPDKQTISKIKLELTKLKSEHAKVIRLVNIAKPASLPPLVTQYAPGTSTSTGNDMKSSGLPIIGKRIKLKVQFPANPSTEMPIASLSANQDEEEEEEEEENEEPKDVDDVKMIEKYSSKIEENAGVDSDIGESEKNLTREEVDIEMEQMNESANSSASSLSSTSSDEEVHRISDFTSIKSFHNTMTFKKFEKILKKGLPPFADKHQEKLQKILNNLKKLAANEDRMHVDWKMLSAKKRKVMKLISDLRTCEPNEKLEHKVSSELNRILSELNTMTEQKYKVIDKVKKMGNEIKSISEAIDKDFEEYRKGMTSSKYPENKIQNNSMDDASEKNLDSETTQQWTDGNEVLDEKKKKKNQRRIQLRQEKAEIERQRGYEEDARREDYNMWVPPRDQTGDGRTTLNDELGY